MVSSFADRIPPSPAFAICFIAFHLLALVMGSGAALLLLPRAARRDALALAPIFGLGVLDLAGWYLMFAGPPGTNGHWPWVVGIGAAITVAGIALRRRELREAVDRDLPWLALGAVVCVLLYAHAVTGGDRLTAAGQNNDIANYSNIERQLQDLPGDARMGPSDQMGLVRFARVTVIGAFLPTATLASMLGVRTYQLQTVCLASYLFWGALLAGVFARRVLGFRRGGAMLVSLVAGAAQVPLFTALATFKSSLAGTAIMLALLIVVLPALGAPAPERPLARAPAVILLAFALAMTYPHMVPIVWAVLGGLAAARALAQRRWGPVLDGARLLAAGLVGAVALSSERAWSTVSYVFEMKVIAAGFPIPPLHLPAMLGLSGAAPYWTLPFGAPGRVIATAAALALVLWGLRRALAEDREAAFTAGALVAIVGLGYAALWLTPGQADPEGYKPFKLLSYFYPALAACLLPAFRAVGAAPATPAGRAWMGGAAALALGVVVPSGVAVHDASWTLQRVTDDAADLQRLESDPRVESINIVSPNYWESMWQVGFLMRKPLSLKYQTYYARSARLQGVWDLEHATREPPDEVLLQEPRDAAPEEIRVNDTYVLRRRRFGLHAEFAEGWSSAEPHHRWSTARHATLLVDTDARRAVSLELRYSHLTPGTTFDVRVDDRAAGACAGPLSCTVGPFDLAPGGHVVSLDASNPPRSPGPADPRRLETSFWRIRLFPVQTAEAP